MQYHNFEQYCTSMMQQSSKASFEWNWIYSEGKKIGCNLILFHQELIGIFFWCSELQQVPMNQLLHRMLQGHMRMTSSVSSNSQPTNRTRQGWVYKKEDRGKRKRNKNENILNRWARFWDGHLNREDSG